MGYWGWRPLVISLFVSVWVVGCNLVNDTATNTAPLVPTAVTLTVGRLGPPTAPTASAVSVEVTHTSPAPAEEGGSPTQTPTLTITPTPTATPIVYIVEEGDTLLEIAIDHDISLEALRAANSDQDLSLLQIGQQIIIPVPTPPPPVEAAAAPLHVPTPTPLPVIVEQPTCYETRVGTILCLGQVENDLDSAVERVSLNVRLLHSDGATWVEQVATVEQGVIRPQEAAPYRAQFDAEWAQYSGAIAELLSADAAENYEARFAILSIEDDQGHMENGRYIVSAVINNADETAVLRVRAIVTLLDEADRVIGYRIVSLSDPLPAGARLPLRIELMPVADAGETVHHRLTVEGLTAGGNS